jgi:sialic acid synthase SpsE/spore coat polysaccharide biosynthesis protein SpsF (cytidylyltransferase family)
MKTIAVIQARMLSQRLRGKTLMSVNGTPLLYRVIANAKALPFIDEVIVATTSLEADKPIIAASHELKVRVVAGSSLNVLNRFVKAIEDLDDNDVIMRLTADNPILIPEVAEKLFNLMRGADYISIDNLSHICPEFVRVKALRELERLSDDQRDLEHVTHMFRRKEGKVHFNVKITPSDFEGLYAQYDPFLTIDTIDDLHRVEAVIEKVGNDVSLDSVYAAIEEVIGLDPNNTVVHLGDKQVSNFSPTYIIAEIGQNHNGSIDLAKQLIDMSKRCGADAVKFQKRDIPSELTKEAFDRPYDNKNSFGATYGEHRMFLELSEEEHRELKEYADNIGITYFCTPCDIPSVELLERIDCPFFKVASRDLTNIPLLEKLGTLGKPVIISTGMASIEDIDNALQALQLPKDKLIIMQCTSEYPCALEHVNLKVLGTLKEKYKVNIGLSDHTSGVIVSASASAIGATVIEKHVTLDRTMKGTDQPGSLEEAGLKKLVEYIRATELAMGSAIKEVNPATEEAKIKLARSLTSLVKVKAGTVLEEKHLCLKSPGDGIKWMGRDSVLGKKAKVDIEADVTLRLEDFE